jgi:hypothetical protein
VTISDESLIRTTRWALANEMRKARRVIRALRREALNTSKDQFQYSLTLAYKQRADHTEETLAALRFVSRCIRGRL